MMNSLLIFPYYIQWHYGRALKNIVAITHTIIWFNWNFFSIELLAKTLFAPWQRLHEESTHRFDVEDVLSRLIINGVMRLVGAVVRLTFIVIGSGAIVLSLIAGIVVFVAWLLLPLLILFCLIFGLTLLIRPV